MHLVIWVTGLSASGKTTLCHALWDFLKSRLPQLVLLDGDVIRTALGDNLGYREQDRVVQIKRMQSLAKMLAEQGLVVMVAALYANPELLVWNRRYLPGYFEVYLESSLDSLRSRDVKGLYAAAESGNMQHVVGVDIPWHAPESPDLIINIDDGESPEQIAMRVVAAVPRLDEVSVKA